MLITLSVFVLIIVGVIIECPQLIDPAEGDVAMSGNNPGSSATYTCRTGYALTGDDIRFCQNDGTWSGNDPFCRCKCTDLSLSLLPHTLAGLNPL